MDIHLKETTSIRGFHIEYMNRFIFSGTFGGMISILELGVPGKEKLIKELSSFNANIKIRVVRYFTKRHELIIGDSSGRVIIWSIATGEPVYAWKAHEDEITQMQFDDTNLNLITSSKDKLFRIWKLPEAWIDDAKLNLAKREIRKSQLEKKLSLDCKKYVFEDSEDDDLIGWDYNFIYERVD